MPNPPPRPSMIPSDETTPYIKRIKDAIFKISEHAPTQYRAFLDAYYQHVSPTMAKNGESMLPTGLRRHPRDPQRTQMVGRNYALFFHVGDAVIAFYNAWLKVGTGYMAALGTAVAKLEDIANRGYSHFVVEGDERVGFHLVHKDEVKVSFLKVDGENDEKHTEKE